MARGDHLVHNDRTYGCLLISSPQGHAGKTIVAVGLCKLLSEQGLSIQPFKKGPDYIDPSWLTIASGRKCRNLDLFLIPKYKLVQSFERAFEETDLAIVEGAMGLYDGLDSNGTTAHIAQILKIPVILVVNVSRMTGSIAAMVSGYQNFEEDVNIGGVILNHVSGKRHEIKLRDAVEKFCQIPVVGSIPRDIDLKIPERHLGLIPSSETDEAGSIIELIGRKLEPYLDLDNILTIARSFKTNNSHYTPLLKGGEGGLAQMNYTSSQNLKTKIGVIRDKVFNFYYPENLEALAEAGAELIFIDSLNDRLPDIDGLYIGGGFPEFFLEELEKNYGLREDIAKGIKAGLPVYAECAGLMYLCRKIHWQGQSYEMVGVIPAEVEIGDRPQGHGYVIAHVISENPYFPIGSTIRGHEFHHSKIIIHESVRFVYQLSKGYGVDGKNDGILYKNMFATYTHLHALGATFWAEGFVSLAERERKRI